MLHSLLIFAQNAAKEEAPWFANPMLPMLAIAAFGIIFLMYLPERNRRKQQQAMMSSIKVKDRVLTLGGIIGIISNIADKGDEVTIRLEEGKMRVQKSAIVRVLSADEAAPAEAIKKS